MDYTVSRTEKKRQAKEIETLSKELAELSPAELLKLPCDDFLRQEIKAVRKLKAGSRKRQIKYIAKELRKQSIDELLNFLEERRGSHLKTNIAHKELERLKNDIIAAALDEYNDRDDYEGYFFMDRKAPPLKKAIEMFPALNIEDLAKPAENFAATRKVGQSREIFRALKAAAEKLKFTTIRDK
ncbi:MAG: ribosome biogenesis factor YjgA [Thermodesulfobacteriota bacterium]